MPQSKLTRHTVAFLLILVASALLYPAAQSGMMAAIWLLTGLIVLAAILTLITR